MRRTGFGLLLAAKVLAAGCSQGATGNAETSGGSTSGAAAGTASGGASSGGATSTGGSTTGGTSATSGGCLPTSDGGSSLYLGDNCTDDSACCGLTCVFAAGAGTCEPACLTTADCPLPYTVCKQGECTIALCGGPGEATFNARCDLADAGDGSCVAPAGEGLVEIDGGGYLGNCLQGGTAVSGAPCNGNALRSSPSQLCVAGDVCTYATINPQCFQSCDPSAADAGCPAGTSCQPYSEASDAFAACL